MVLVAEATVDLGCGVPLLRRGLVVVGEDAIDDGGGRPVPRSRSIPGSRGGWLGMAEDMPDGLASVTDLADGDAIASSPSDSAVVVHGEHVLSLRVGGRSLRDGSP